MTTLEIQTAFQTAMPELEKHLTYNSKRFPEPDEAFSEMLASSWINFRSKALRTGELLSPSSLAWMARIQLHGGRTLVGFSNADVLGEQTFKSGRVRVVLFSQLTTPRRRHKLTADELARVTAALTTSERDHPPVRAAMKIDWEMLAKTLDARLQIVAALAIGETKVAIAKQLGISAGRVSQLLLADLASKIADFFGLDNLPDWCW